MLFAFARTLEDASVRAPGIESLKRLREPEMDLVLAELIDGVGAVRLRDQETRRIEQVAVVNSDLASDRRFDAEAEADRVRPEGAQISLKHVIGRHVGRIENIAHSAEHIAAIVKRNSPKGFGERNSRFQIDYRQGVAAERDGERIEENRFALAVTENTLRYDDDTRPGLFEIEPAKGIRSAGEEAFADRKNSVKARESRR